MKLSATIISVFAVVLFASLFLSSLGLSVDVLLVEYFYIDPSRLGNCPTCYDSTTDRIIRDIKREYGDKVHVEWLDISTPFGSERFQNYNLTTLPAVVINQEYKLSGTHVTTENLESIINQILGGTPVDSPANDDSLGITLSLVVVSALVDGINPCAFALLVFFLSYLFSIHRSRGSILVMGTLYVTGLFITYFSIGFGLLQSVSFFGIEHLFSWIGIILMIALGLVTMTDYIIRGKFSIKFPSKVVRTRARILRMVPALTRNVKKAAFPVALMLGGLVGLCEFPCTGGIYYGILIYLATETTLRLAYLALYNFLFVLPLIIILLFASNIKTLTKIDTWRLERKRQIKLVSGIFMITLGLLVLYWMIS